MTRTKKLVGTAIAVVTLAIIATTTFPTNRVSSTQMQATQYEKDVARMRSEIAAIGANTPVASPAEREPTARLHYAKTDDNLVRTDSKVIRNADLSLVVRDVRETATEIVKLITASHGTVDRLELSESREGCFSATLSIRVPSSGLEDAVTQLKALALRTEHEQISARDVTREFYDNEAHLRNLHAEEQQYLAIMRQTGKIPDTLQVAERLSDVRDRIERQQAAIQVMNHDIDMSLISITLSKQVETKIAGFEWRPMQNARAAMREVLIGLSEWLDAVVALIIKLPLLLVWLFSISTVGWAMLLIGRWIWRRVRHLIPQVGRSTQPLATSDPEGAKS